MDDTGWQTLLEAAVATVAGSEAGSLFVRANDAFRIHALVGYSPALLGARQTTRSFHEWYDEPERGGVLPPRVRRGERLQLVAQSPLDLSGTVDETLAACAVLTLPVVCASLCVPVLMNGEVVAHLNLESLSDPGAFGPGTLQVAQDFAQQVGAILTARAHRAGETARNRELEALAALNLALRPARTPEAIERLLTEQTVALLGTRYATVLRYDSAADVLRATASHGLQSTPVGLVLHRGRGLSWTAVESRQVTSFQNPLQDPRSYVHTALEQLATLYAPLIASDGTLLGVLAVGRERVPFTNAELRLADVFAAAAATALERALETQAVRETREGALLALGLALEVRDFETQGHTERVVQLAEALGRACHLTDTELEALRQGAYLHDIGKLGVPDSVLLKPGKLDEQEWSLMQAHTTTGYSLVCGIPTLPEQARQVVRHHHERWNGRGYPDGLAGSAIPYLARLFAVVDVYDALTNERPYKRAWSHQAAIQEIEVQSGQQFDPEVVRMFVAFLNP